MNNIRVSSQFLFEVFRSCQDLGARKPVLQSAIGLNDADLHTAPSVESPVMAHLFREDAAGNLSGADSFNVARLISCQADWVQVDGTFLGTHLTGWATRTCSNQVTTCP